MIFQKLCSFAKLRIIANYTWSQKHLHLCWIDVSKHVHRAANTWSQVFQFISWYDIKNLRLEWRLETPLVGKNFPYYRPLYETSVRKCIGNTNKPQSTNWNHKNGFICRNLRLSFFLFWYFSHLIFSYKDPHFTLW